MIVIIGPTASGKTKLAIELAKDIDGEIISADSMQVYKYMDIGTAKPTKEEMQGVKHYLIDEVAPDVEFNVAKYQKLALKYIEEIIQKEKVPIIVGGTGLYINSLLYNINYSESICNPELREKLQKEAEEFGNEYLHKKLEEIDPEAAKKLHENDVRRVIRAIEVFNHTNKPISEHQESSRLVPSKYNFTVIGLKIDREKLYERINKRVELMIEKGLVNEVKKLVDLGYNIEGSTAMQGLGYKEILAYIRGDRSFEDTLYILKRDSRHYAKRQITWFKRIENIVWIDINENIHQDEVAKNIKNCIATSGIFL